MSVVAPVSGPMTVNRLGLRSTVSPGSMNASTPPRSPTALWAASFTPAPVFTTATTGFMDGSPQRGDIKHGVGWEPI